jgi:hypothetical protein
LTEQAVFLTHRFAVLEFEFLWLAHVFQSFLDPEVLILMVGIYLQSIDSLQVADIASIAAF